MPLIQQGLSDNWSQVRYASSLCARSFYAAAGEDSTLRDKYDGMLVPRMCLNRYYVAEGVRVYSNDTWRQCFGEQGKQLVCKYADEVAAFYISQSEADNHAVREAACACISELCSKVAGVDEASKEPFRKHITNLLDALVDCFKDESWPVRDAACAACGAFVATFPEESQPKYEELCKLWIDHLSDNIFSVRWHSAAALARVYAQADMYRDDLLGRIAQYCDEHILKAKEQKSQSESFAGLSNETQFGVAKGVHKHQHDTAHENATMYSCGSLAPKLKRGGGCMDHGFSRATEPWEHSDGCIYVFRELAKARNQSDPKVVSKAIDLFVKHAMSLADLGFVDHFKHSASMKENLFKTMREIVSPEGIGKKKFRSFVEIFLDPAFRNVNHNS